MRLHWYQRRKPTLERTPGPLSSHFKQCTLRIAAVAAIVVKGRAHRRMKLTSKNGKLQGVASYADWVAVDRKRLRDKTCFVTTMFAPMPHTCIPVAMTLLLKTMLKISQNRGLPAF